jgi:hypothetical protein
MVNISQPKPKIPPLQVGDGKLKKRIEFQIGWKKFKITINW